MCTLPHLAEQQVRHETTSEKGQFSSSMDLRFGPEASCSQHCMEHRKSSEFADVDHNTFCPFAADHSKFEELRQHLERKCDGDHEHLRWGTTFKGFATAEECAYNNMCAAWAEGIYDFAIAQGFTPPPTTL